MYAYIFKFIFFETIKLLLWITLSINNYKHRHVYILCTDTSWWHTILNTYDCPLGLTPLCMAERSKILSSLRKRNRFYLKQLKYAFVCLIIFHYYLSLSRYFVKCTTHCFMEQVRSRFSNMGFGFWLANPLLSIDFFRMLILNHIILQIIDLFETYIKYYVLNKTTLEGIEEYAANFNKLFKAISTKTYDALDHRYDNKRQ